MGQTPAAEATAVAGSERLAEIYVDAEEVARARAKRDVRHHTREVPALRLVGMVLLGLLVWLHARHAAGVPARPGYPLFLAAMLAYAALSWLLLDRLYRPLRARGVHLGTGFLIVDLAWFAGAVFFSGGSESWLFFILLARVADQSATSFRKVLVFAHLSVASYLGVLVVQRLCTSAPIDWRAELAKTTALYFMSLYICGSARTAEALRNRGSRAIRDARALIEALREQTAALARAKARADEASRAKSEFFANLSHELRTPLTAALGFLDLALDSELGAEQREYLDHVVVANRNLCAVLDQLIDLARLESRSLVMARVPLDLGALGDESLQRISEAAAAKGLEVGRAQAGIERLAVLGDPVRLRQILGSLLDNAVKFTERGRVELGIAAAPADLRAEVVEVIFTVSDTGIGIPGDRHGAIFALSQLDGSSTRRAGGLGLGLALTSRLVAAMAGRLWLESEPGRGSRFHVALPLPRVRPSG